MRVLTVQQPWAWAIFHGKDVENRTQLWTYRGPLAIHAGTRWSERGAESPLVREAAGKAWEAATGLRSVGSTFYLDADDYPWGAILGTVDLVDAHHQEPGCCASPWAETSYVEHGGRTRRQLVHLVLENAREFATPVPNVRGRLGLWTPDPELLVSIVERQELAA